MIPDDGGDSGLFLTPVPVPPGDPAALAKGAATYTAAHGELERDRAMLTGAAGQADGATWSGLGATAFVATTDELAAAYALTCSALAKGASTLRTYAAALTVAKETAHSANNAIAKANALASALFAAQSAADGAQRAAVETDQAATTAEAQAAANPHSPAAKVAAENARSTATQSQTAATDAWNKVNSLQAQYDAARATALSLAAEAKRQATEAAMRANAGFEAAAVDLMGLKPKPARGGAHGVTGGGSGAWQDLVAHLAKWNDTAGWALNSWGAFGAVVTGRAEAAYAASSAKLSSASAAEDEAFWKWYSREGSWFDWAPKAQAYNSAATGAAASLKDLRESITPGKGLMGVVGRVGLVAGIGSDVVTEISPSPSFGPDGLLGGNTDRVMAGANMVASGLALGDSFGVEAASAALAIPGVDVVAGGVLVGTAVYFGGEFVYQHWHGIEHGVESVGHGIAHGLSSAASWVGNELGL